MEDQLLILLSEEGADPERVAQMTHYLREELLELDVDDVTSVPGGDAPPGARAVNVTEIGSLLVALGHSFSGLQQTVTVLRGWLSRHRDRGSRPALRLRLGEDELEISQATDEEVTRAFDEFIRRHTPAEKQP